MSRQNIFTGTTANDGTGDTLRQAFTKTNDNFIELYSQAVPGGSNTQLQYNNAGTFAGATGLTTNGTELTIASGTKAADAPVLNMSQTWNNAAVTFTGLKFNATDTASASGSLLMDLQVGGVSKFKITKGGMIDWIGGGSIGAYPAGGSKLSADTASNGLAFYSGSTCLAGVYSPIPGFYIGSAASGVYSVLTAKAAANLRFGAADAAVPVAQTLSVQSVVAGTTNAAGANFTITGSQGTGTGAGGSIIFQVAPAGSSGSAQNALAAALTISGAGDATFASGKIIYGSFFVNNSMSGVDYFHGANLYANMSLSLKSDAKMGWSATTPGSTMDVTLFRDTSNTLALRNGTNAQTYRLYGTFTDTSNYERGYLATDSNGFTIGTEALGTGTKRPVRIIGPSLASAESVSALELSQTWNTSGTPTGLKLNITDTASNAASLLMDLQTGGISTFAVSKLPASGFNSVVIGGGLTLRQARNQNYAQLLVSTGQLAILGAGQAFTGLQVNSIMAFSWCSVSDINAGGASDLFLTRRGAANLRLGAADVGATTATVTITIAAPGVVTWSGHSLSTGTPVVFTTTGALPTGIVSGTTYYAVVVDANTFQIASSVANAIAATPTVITTSGTQSGTHTGTRYNITQRLSMQSITGVTDRLGADLFIQGSQGTGTGAGGSIIFQVAPASPTSNGVQNGLATTAQFGPFQGKLYLGSASPTISNHAMWGDGTNTWVNAPTSGGYVHFGSLDNWGVAVHPASVRISSNFTLGWTASNPGAALDLILARDAANTLALRNGTAAQAFNIYNTFTDASNYECGKIAWLSNVLTIGTDKLGTGTARTMVFQTDGTTRVTLNNSNIIEFSYSQFNFGGGSRLYSLANGVLGLGNSSNAPGSLVFGSGASSVTPRLTPSSAELRVRLGDDSAYTTIDALLRSQGTAPASATATGTAGDIRYDSGFIYVCTATNTWKRVAIATW